MQPIERYGVAALLFLIVTVGAVVLWDQNEANAAEKAAAAVQAPGAKTALESNLVASLKEEKAPVKRQPKKPQPARGNGRVNAGAAAQKMLAEQGKGGLQAGGVNLTNSDDWSRGTKSELRIPTEAMNQKRKQAERERALALLADTEKNLALATAPASKKIGTGALLDVSGKWNANSGKSKIGGKTAKSASKTQTYKVVAGDTLGQIAEDQLGGYSKLGELLKANPGVSLDSSLTVGKSLNIPDIGQGLPKPSVSNAIFTKPNSAKAKAGRSYTVQEGDSLWGIAQSQLGHGSRNVDIRAANPQLKSNVLSVGMVLALPEGSASKSTVAANAAKKSEPKTAVKKPRFKPGVVR